MRRPEVVWQTRRAGGGTVWVRRPRGGWRAITFASAPTAAGKLLGLCGVLNRLGAATTVPLRTGCVLAAQAVPGPDTTVPALLPRPGPARTPLAPNAP